MRDSTGARIIFPTVDDQDQELITVVGTEEAVKEATKELEELIKSLVSPPYVLFVSMCSGSDVQQISYTLFQKFLFLAVLFFYFFIHSFTFCKYIYLACKT